MRKRKQRAWRAWASWSLLAALCAALAFLQYQWIGEISGAQRRLLREDIDARLDLLRRSFNESLLAAGAALEPDAAQIRQLGNQKAYQLRFEEWKGQGRPLFRKVALAEVRQGSSVLYQFDFNTGLLNRAEWPREWAAVRQDCLEAAPWVARAPQYPLLLESRFDPPGQGAPGERDWLILELDTAYVSRTLFPELLGRYLRNSGKLDYEIEVALREAPATVIFQSEPGASLSARGAADASTLLVEGYPGFAEGGRGNQPGRNPGAGPPPGGPGRAGFSGRGPGGEPPQARSVMTGQGLVMTVRHKAGSLDALVTRGRRQNLALSAGMLVLILATAALLVRASRQAQRLAELQMNFVAGVSHELRTPLTVIRTAGFNLRGSLAGRPEQVQRYGKLIQDESERLSTLVEQVLRFGAASAGSLVRHREPVALPALIEESLEAHREALQKAAVAVETEFAPDLPPVLADKLALKHALQNLIDNALKFSAAGGWIGITASTLRGHAGPAVELRVADRGEGIPEEERKAIFEPFFRGRRAIKDQIHGAGLGLDLVKKIVEAHGGSISVENAPGQGAAFVLRLPAAQPDSSQS